MALAYGRVQALSVTAARRACAYVPSQLSLSLCAVGPGCSMRCAQVIGYPCGLHMSPGARSRSSAGVISHRCSLSVCASLSRLPRDERARVGPGPTCGGCDSAHGAHGPPVRLAPPVRGVVQDSMLCFVCFEDSVRDLHCWSVLCSVRVVDARGEPRRRPRTSQRPRVCTVPPPPLNRHSILNNMT